MFVLIFSVYSHEIGWEERFQTDLFCFGWDVKPKLNQSVPVSILACIVTSSSCIVYRLQYVDKLHQLDGYVHL